MPLQPWRILLPRLADSPMDLDEELFQSMLELEEQRERQEFLHWDEASSWALDQDNATLTLYFDDDTEISAKIQIVGTFDGDTFMWAWNNPSVLGHLTNDALRLREHGEKHGWSIFSQPKFDATVRDGYAFMALASSLFKADGAYAGEAHGTVTYLTLRDLPETTQPSSAQPEFEPRSMMDNMTDQLAEQLGNVQLTLNDMRDIEHICRRGYVLSQLGQHLVAAESFDEAWEKLGEMAADQEPASWIKLAKGNALFLAGKFEEALETLLEAEHLFACPDIGLLYQRIGQSYAELGNTEQAIQAFARVYVAKGKNGLEELSAVQADLFYKEFALRRVQAQEQIAARKSKRRKSKQYELAEATVSCIISKLNSFELEAHQLQETANRLPKKSILETQAEVEETINSHWTWLLALFCTPNRSPLCESLQYPPSHDPDNEKINRIYRTKEGRIAVETASADAFGSNTNWRYELEEVDGVLLLNQLFSVWDDEEYPCI